jgi:hypothetical protein
VKQIFKNFEKSYQMIEYFDQDIYLMAEQLILKNAVLEGLKENQSSNFEFLLQ